MDEPTPDQVEPAAPLEEENEGKEEKKEAPGRVESAVAAAASKMTKFRFDVTNSKHRTLLEGLVPIFLDIIKHMGVIIHGLNTCGAERFARERYVRHRHNTTNARTARAAHALLWINRTRLTPKAYSFATWRARCLATALQFHFRTGTFPVQAQQHHVHSEAMLAWW